MPLILPGQTEVLRRNRFRPDPLISAQSAARAEDRRRYSSQCQVEGRCNVFHCSPTKNATAAEFGRARSLSHAPNAREKRYDVFWRALLLRRLRLPTVEMNGPTDSPRCRFATICLPSMRAFRQVVDSKMIGSQKFEPRTRGL
jgi:hypothetical protein